MLSPMTSELDGSSLGERPSFETISQAVGRLAANELVVVHNATVYAVMGNAKSPTLFEDINELKRDTERTSVGWTVPFHRRVMDLVDTSDIEDKHVRGLLEDGNELTGYFGGLGFVRMPATPKALRSQDIPRGLISQEEGTVQPYSPTGNDFASRLIRAAYSRGVEPVMSSANFHFSPEIVHRKEAVAFVDAAVRPPMILEDGITTTPNTKPLGSYPIITVSRTGEMTLTREGCFTGELIQRLFAGYPLQIEPHGQRSSAYPENMFGIDDLPERYRSLTGAQLRLAMLATLGWNADAGILLDEELASSAIPPQRVWRN